MKKILSAVAVTLASLLTIITMPACVKKSFRLTDVFKQMASPPQSIDVSIFDSYIGSFTVTDVEQINVIYQYLIGYEYFLVDDAIAPGTNRSLNLNYGGEGKDIKLSTRSIHYKGRRYGLEYTVASYDLDEYLKQIGIEIGCVTVH